MAATILRAMRLEVREGRGEEGEYEIIFRAIATGFTKAPGLTFPTYEAARTVAEAIVAAHPTLYTVEEG